MGLHRIDRDERGGPGTCRNCGVPTVLRQRRQVCPIAWREQHGSRPVRPDIVFQAEAAGEEVARTKPRLRHNLSAKDGVVSCMGCGLVAVPLPNGSYACPSQEKQALGGISRQSVIQEARVRRERSYAGTLALLASEEFSATSKSRKYRTLSGRVRGAEKPTSTAPETPNPTTVRPPLEEPEANAGFQPIVLKDLRSRHPSSK